MRFWAKWILYLSGVFPVVKNKSGKHALKNLPHPCVYCANHGSYLDIVLSYFTMPNYFIFMGKSELKKAPLFRIFFERMNILVHRKNSVAAHKSYIEAIDRLKKGESIFLFPEGTISKVAPRMIPFKNGAFHLAIEAQVPIVPVTYVNNYRFLQTGAFLRSNGRPGTTKVIVHKPIETKGLTTEDLVNLRQKVFETIQSGLE